MSDEQARPIEKPTRGPAVMAEAIKRWLERYGQAILVGEQLGPLATPDMLRDRAYQDEMRRG